MKKVDQGKSILEFQADRVNGMIATHLVDTLSVEEPLEIRIVTDSNGDSHEQSVAVTMRTPGEDRELAAGFLFTEGIISSPSDLCRIEVDQCNVVNAYLTSGVFVDPSILERHSFMASSCGICGKKSIAAVRVRSHHQTIAGLPLIDPAIIHSLPDLLRSSQAAFASTGGIHASGLFDSQGKLVALREDVGRHNALDKLIGSEFLADRLPLNQSILLVSGRASFELVQKASHAGIPILAAIGAPSSLAVQLAEECGMTLLGFVRDRRFNIYAGSERMLAANLENFVTTKATR